MVLHGGDPRDQRGGLRGERLADELEGVAQPLAGDPQLVEGLDVRPAEDRLVGSDTLVRGEDLRCRGVADAMRLGRRDGDDGEALVADELAVVLEPAPVAVGVELADQQLAGVVAMGPPARQEGLEGPLLCRRQVGPIGVGGLEEHVEVTDGPQPRSNVAEVAAVGPRPAGPERRPEDAPGGSLAAGRDPHRVEVLGILAVAGPRLAGEHPGEVEAEDLAAGLGDVVVGQNAGRLADDESRCLRARQAHSDHLGRIGGPGRTVCRGVARRLQGWRRRRRWLDVALGFRGFGGRPIVAE